MRRATGWTALACLIALAIAPALADEATTGGDAEAREKLAEDAEATRAKDGTDAETEAEGTAEEGAKMISGMSVLGNQEAPKSLVIVPWKSSQIGDSLGIASMQDDARRPVDRDVFLRELRYYEIRSEGAP